VGTEARRSWTAALAPRVATTHQRSLPELAIGERNSLSLGVVDAREKERRTTVPEFGGASPVFRGGEDFAVAKSR
jgi:hypothetical protein